VCSSDLLQKIEVDDFVQNSLGTSNKIISIEQIHIPPTKVYTLSTETNAARNYYANSILAHNKERCGGFGDL
jgi:hypothetical protein